MELKNEILKDYEQYCHKKLQSEFGDYKSTNQSAMKLYQRYKHRILNVCPRRVRELNNITIPLEHVVVYNRIVSDITQGVELKKYQSKRLKDLNYNDDMLSHWGIQHFHLGAALGKDGFVSRTGDLLFIHFTNSQAYIIGLFPHNNWCDLDIIEKIHQNWPEILIEHKYSSNDQFLTEEEYKTLRAKNYNALVTVQDGTKYLPPGSGVMCDGTPIGAINKLQKLMMIFEKSFNDISLNIDQIFESDPKKQKSDTVTIGLEINDMNQRCVYVIKETGHRFTLNY